MWRAFGFTFVALMLSGCASLEDFANIFAGKASQKITKTPIWLYQPDAKITVDGMVFTGRAVTTLRDFIPIQVESLVNGDRIVVSSCSRYDVCQWKAGSLACDKKTKWYPEGAFEVEDDWFGNPKKNLTYYFRPSERERQGSCANLTIEIYDKNVLAAWGHVFLRNQPERQFPARFSCNAKNWIFQGVSVCSTKDGYIQKVFFDAPIEKSESSETCGMKKINDKEFEFKPDLGWCSATFYREGKFHKVVLHAFDEVLVREK